MVNVYAWDSEARAQAFFDASFHERVTAAYGARPSVTLASVVATVVN